MARCQDAVMDQPETPICSPLHGTVVSLEVSVGSVVRPGSVLMLVESMKLHHEVIAPAQAVVLALRVVVGDTVRVGDALVDLEAVDLQAVDLQAVDLQAVDLQATDLQSSHSAARDRASEAAFDTASGAASGAPALDASSGERADLAEVIERHRVGRDEARPDAVARRRRVKRRTARENVADLLDEGTFVEYGPLAIAAQRRRRSLEDLIANTPADGLIGGVGTVNGDRFEGRRARCIAVSYDYTVLAGTQGTQNHRKKDRLFEVAEQLRLPIVFFTEGGGGRPGDTDALGISGLDCLAFHWFAQLSGLVPLVGIASGYCFAGNAAILGCCDVVIATEDSNIGMGGPAMIEGGGLGVYAPTEIGPVEVQRSNGVIDVVVADEAEAVAVAKQYLSYFQGPLADWTCADPERLREVVPVDRLRSYDVRKAIELMFDTGSVLELRREFGVGMITAFARIEGVAVGVVANNPAHLAGAIDSNGADKAARFMQLCDAYGIPLITLCDTPGMMVGPEVEATALVRHCSRLFVTGANLSVPMVTVVLRKAYGLGAQAMMGGTTKAPLACLAWPTGEFGGMGLEGAVRLGYRKELEAAADEAAREALFTELVNRMYEHGRAVSVASYFEIDDVIDPADTRRWISTLLSSAPPCPDLPTDGHPKRRPHIDTW
jgi:acetyl-CoA carboxylase carboxyltransferase component